MTCPFTPRENWVVVKRFPDSKISKGGVIIPDRAILKLDRGTVLAIGPGRYTDHGIRVPITELEVGNIVRWAGGGATEIEFDGETFTMIPAPALVVVEKPNQQGDQ